jgi:hypothetical protein
MEQIMNDFKHDFKFVAESLNAMPTIAKGSNSSALMASINSSMGLCHRNMERMTGYDMDMARQMERELEKARMAYSRFFDAGY